MAMQILIYLVMKVVAVVIFTPIFLVPALLVALADFAFGHVFMKAQMSVKRELSNAKAPVLGHFGAAVSGISKRSTESVGQCPNVSYAHLASIRAYGAQEAFKAESYRRIDKYTRASIINVNLNL